MPPGDVGKGVVKIVNCLLFSFIYYFQETE